MKNASKAVIVSPNETKYALLGFSGGGFCFLAIAYFIGGCFRPREQNHLVSFERLVATCLSNSPDGVFLKRLGYGPELTRLSLSNCGLATDTEKKPLSICTG